MAAARQVQGARADHPLADRAVLHGAEGLLLRGAAGRAADLALPALRLRRPGGPGPAAAQDAGGGRGGLVALPGRRRLRLLRGAAGRAELPARLRRRRLPHPGARGRVLRLRHHAAARVGADVRGAGGDARARPHRRDQRGLLHPPLAGGDRGDRGPGRGPAGRRPLQHDAADDPPDRCSTCWGSGWPSASAARRCGRGRRGPAGTRTRRAARPSARRLSRAGCAR